jgi:spore coat polysaccharide biosynthesis protein SpsF
MTSLQDSFRFGIIVQARMGSKRLPGKVLAPIQGRPLIDYVLQSLQNCGSTGALIVATSNLSADDAIADYCDLNNVVCYRGPEENVAARFFELTRRYKWDAFFRVSADSPLLDYRLLDQIAEQYVRDPVDLITNVFPRTFPRGQSVELLHSKTFVEAYPMMQDQEDLEHVTRFFYRNAKNYNVKNIHAPKDMGHVHMAVDEDDDLQVAKKVLTKMRRFHWSYTLPQKVALWTEEKRWLGRKAA